MTTDPKARGTSSDSPVHERRRSERVLIRIPIILYGLTKDNRHVSEDAETAVISRSGAMLRAHTAFKPGATIDLTNSFSRDCEKFRVVWVSEEQKQGHFDIGVEMQVPRDDFWGITFPARPASKP